MRDGRISHIEYVDYPNENQRKDIILYNLKKGKISLNASLTIDDLVVMTAVNFNNEPLAGSDVEALIKKAANLARWRYGKEIQEHGSIKENGLTREDIELAKSMRQL
jgi:SpoVK/Ycf46/Vps4 family AAA+-type ATPase